MAFSTVGAPTVPLPRVPAGEAAHASWYRRVLGWAVTGGPPGQLVTGTRFDVLELPSDSRRGAAPQARRHRAGGPHGAPDAVPGGRGGAEELEGLLDWLEWGGVDLELTGLGAGGRITAPAPPGEAPDPGEPPCGCDPRAGL